MKRSVLAIARALLLSLTIFTAASSFSVAAATTKQPQAKVPHCGQKAAKTYFTRGTMRMYLRKVTLTNHQTGKPFLADRMYACSSKLHKSVALEMCEFSYECFSKQFVWDGRYLTYNWENIAPTTSYGNDALVADLKAGVASKQSAVPRIGGDADPQCAQIPCLRGSIWKIAAGWGPRYAIGYQVSGEPYGAVLNDTTFVVESHCWSPDLSKDTVTVLDHVSSYKDLKSLKTMIDATTKADTAHWTNNGEKKSAAIC